MRKTGNQDLLNENNFSPNGVIIINDASSFNVHRAGEDEIFNITPVVGTKVSTNSWTFEIKPIVNQDGTTTATVKIRMFPQKKIKHLKKCWQRNDLCPTLSF